MIEKKGAPPPPFALVGMITLIYPCVFLFLKDYSLTNPNVREYTKTLIRVLEKIFRDLV